MGLHVLRKLRINEHFEQDLNKLAFAVESISSEPNNWIVSNLEKEGQIIKRIELKPLNISRYRQKMFWMGDKTLMMSATILDAEAFCSSVGLDFNAVKVIRVGSDFPLEQRPIRSLFPLPI